MTPHRWLKGRLSILILLLVCVVCMPGSVMGADVDVYAEGAYTDTNLVLYIYADINSGPILSFGVKVEYPAGLNFVSAEKNEDVWYFGDGAADFPYMDPQDDGSGVVIIGGKLNTAAPTAGVTGSRVELGKIEFSHSGVTNFSGVNLTYAHGTGDPADTYKNFVATDGAVKDGGGVSFSSPIVAQRCDANADNFITNSDMFAVRQLLIDNIFKVYADCNNDGVLTNSDMFSIRGKL